MGSGLVMKFKISEAARSSRKEEWGKDSRENISSKRAEYSVTRPLRNHMLKQDKEQEVEQIVVSDTTCMFSVDYNPMLVDGFYFMSSLAATINSSGWLVGTTFNTLFGRTIIGAER
ncbi:hypothetical protein D5086_010643 [Populus alba]|uniref:Uncharacterized protein n=1 Tax=Populus alba TaxID=43335 RepID=A0ACC4CAE0_POPAL